MKPRTVLLFFGLIFALAIALSDGQKVRKKSTAKVQVQKVSGGKKGATSAPVKAKATTKKKKKKGTTKSSLSKSNNEVQDSTVIDEYAPDNEKGTDCYDSCFPDAKMLDAGGKILNPSQYGQFIEMCGKTYLFGSKKITWEENWKTCCSIGMQPIIYGDQQELDCLISGGKVPNAEGTNYWTGGYKSKIHSLWSWCTKDTPEPVDEYMASDITQDRLQKNGPPADCLSASYITKSSTGNFNLFGNVCDDKAANLACESVEKVPADLLPDTKCRAKCPKTCSKNNLLSNLNQKQEHELSERYKYGRWVSKCGRYFLFSKTLATQEKAREICCSMGMKLLSVKTSAKRKCLSKLTKDYPDTTGEYWTSGSDAGCDGNFRWCSVDRAFLKKEVTWAKSEPDTKRGDCVLTNTSKVERNSLLLTENCDVQKKFICEVKQSESSPEAVHKRCVSFLDLTPDEVDNLKNVDAYTYKMKCYLKCMGDNLGALINGTMQEGNLMRLAEASNVKVEQKFNPMGSSPVDVCNKRIDKTDDCQSAFQFFKCIKEQAPNEFEQMVNRNQNKPKPNVPVEITNPRGCNILEIKCQIEASFRNKFQSSGEMTDGGSAVIDWEGRRWYKSVYAPKHSYLDAYVTCCKYDMELPWAKTLEDFKKMFDFMNGTTQDNFYLPTISDPEGEKWCDQSGKLIDPQLSNDGFKQLREKSILYTQKNFQPKYKLTAGTEANINVNYFYCKPLEELE